MGKFLISVNAAACTGCMKCGLACSELYQGAFNPLLAHIRVIVKGEDAEVSFTPECTECGVCVDQCFYGALSKTPRES